MRRAISSRARPGQRLVVVGAEQLQIAERAGGVVVQTGQAADFGVDDRAVHDRVDGRARRGAAQFLDEGLALGRVSGDHQLVGGVDVREVDPVVAGQRVPDGVRVGEQHMAGPHLPVGDGLGQVPVLAHRTFGPHSRSLKIGVSLMSSSRRLSGSQPRVAKSMLDSPRL